MAKNNPKDMQTAHETATDAQSTLYTTGVTLPVFTDEYLIELGWSLVDKPGWRDRIESEVLKDATLQEYIQEMRAAETAYPGGRPKKAKIPEFQEKIPGEGDPPSDLEGDSYRELSRKYDYYAAVAAGRTQPYTKGLSIAEAKSIASQLRQQMADRKEEEEGFLVLKKEYKLRKKRSIEERRRRYEQDLEDAETAFNTATKVYETRHKTWREGLRSAITRVGMRKRDLSESDAIKAVVVQHFVTSVYEKWASLMNLGKKAGSFSTLAQGYGFLMDPPMVTCIDVTKLNIPTENIRVPSGFWKQTLFMGSSEEVPFNSGNPIEQDINRVALAIASSVVIVQYAMPGTVRELPPSSRMDVFIPALGNGQTLTHGVIGLPIPQPGEKGKQWIEDYGQWRRPFSDRCAEVLTKIATKMRYGF